MKKVFVENSIDEGGLAMSTNLGSSELDLCTVQSGRKGSRCVFSSSNLLFKAYRFDPVVPLYEQTMHFVVGC